MDENAPVSVRWRSFPLEQVNNNDSDWRFWKQPAGDVRSMYAFLAIEAVRDQDEALTTPLVMALLRAVHEDRRQPNDLEMIREVAQGVGGIDVQRMVREMADPQLRERIAADYERATNEYGIFGTPTLLFEGGEPVFLKMSPPAPQPEAGDLFSVVQRMSTDMSYVQEVKKATRPETSG